MNATTNSQIPGILYYGNKPVSNPDTFRNLGALQKQLMEIGYKKSLFEKHYYNGNNHSYTQSSSTDYNAVNGSQSYKESESNASQGKGSILESAPQMSFEKHIIHDFRDATWLNHYIQSMGEEEFWNYKQKLYIMLSRIEVEKSIEIQKWCKPENIDLFMKIACCFVQESRSCYCFNNEFNKITHQFKREEHEALVNRTATLRIQALSQQAAPTDSQ